MLQDWVADAVHLWQGEQEQAEQYSAAGRAKPLWPGPEPVGGVFHAVEDANERDAAHCREQAQASVEAVLPGGVLLECRKREKRCRSEGRTADYCRRYRADHDDRE